jgi:hypothetical protein
MLRSRGLLGMSQREDLSILRAERRAARLSRATRVCLGSTTCDGSISALFENVIAGPHPNDHQSLRPRVLLPDRFEGIEGWRVAVSPRLGDWSLDPEVEANTLAAGDAFREAGAIVDEVEVAVKQADVSRAALVARPIGAEQAPGVWLAGRRLVAIDGTCLDVADTAANTAHFGRPGVNNGEQAAFPQARVVALAECGTHAVFAAEIGKYSQSEATLTEPLLDRLEPGMLLLADRGFFSYALWRKAIGTGADLLWRVRTDKAGPKPTHVEDFPDGSWLAHLRRTTPAATRREEPMLVRVMDYTIEDGRENPTTYRLFTTLLDPAEVTAVDLAAAYTQRWEVELTFDELKTHQRGPAPCCARSPPTWSSKRSGNTCAATTRSAL